MKKNKIIKALLKFKPTNESTQKKLIDHFIKCIQTKKQESPSFDDGKKGGRICIRSVYFQEITLKFKK